jgi:hypothetical protein
LVFVEGALEKWLLRQIRTWEGTVKACDIEIGLRVLGTIPAEGFGRLLAMLKLQLVLSVRGGGGQSIR